MEQTVVCNLYGGPGTGKSSTASQLFSLMKWEGEDVELVDEFAKQLVWEEHFNCMADQLWVSANQNRKLERLKGKVRYIITDSPLDLCWVYGQNYMPKTFIPFILDIADQYDNFNVMLRRKKAYNPKGRIQDENGAKDLDGQIRHMLTNVRKGIDFEVDATPDAAPLILERLRAYHYDRYVQPELNYGDFPAWDRLGAAD